MLNKRNGVARSMAPKENKRLNGKQGYSLSDLKGTKFAPLHWVVDDIIVEGLTILSAKPKLGKSWMMFDIAIAAASGGKALGEIPCERMVALYYALEDNPRRMKKRARALLKGGRDWPEDLIIYHELDRLDKNGLQEIRRQVKESDAKLVIIDTYNYIRPPRKGNEEAYSSDYQHLGKLRALAAELRIAIVIVHHVRKAHAEDPLDATTGSTGLQAAVDTVLVLTRNANGTVLHGRGRDLEKEIEKAVEFDRNTCVWRILGEAGEVQISDERKGILRLVEQAGRPVGPKEVAERLKKPPASVTKMFHDMAVAGQLRKLKRGLYLCA